MALTEILLFVIGALGLAYYWNKQNYSYWRRHDIPYLKPMPFIGNIKRLLTVKTSVGLFLSEVYNDESMKNAPVVGTYILHQPALVIRDPEILKSVLIKDFNKFSNRFVGTDPHGDPLASNNLFFMRNPDWKQMRSKLSPVFTSGKIKLMYPLMLEIASELENHLSTYSKQNNAFVTEIKEICALFTTDVIATIAFGIKANSLENPNGEFRTQGRKVLDFDIKRAFDVFIAFYLPKLATLFRIKVFTEEYSSFVRKSINFAMEEREKSGIVRNDLIDILLVLKRELANDEEGKHFVKDNDCLVAQANVFLTAGFETSSSTMAFALYELSKSPDLQERLREEICEAFLEGGGKISYERIMSLEYLGMVIDEVLRLYPVLPFLDRQHEVSKGESGFSLKPYYDLELPNGMPIYIPVFALQHDPKYWPNPEVFDPERFSSENKKRHNPMAYMPFGTGPHNCIGSRIGLLQTRIGLAHILKNHFIEPCEKTVKEMIFDPKAIVLQCEKGIYLRVVNDGKYSVAATVNK